MPSKILRTESEADLAKLRADFKTDLNPTDSIEREYVDEIVHHTWNMRRYQRIETGILDNALRKALARILNEVLLPPSTAMSMERWMSSQHLSYEWMLDPENDRKIVSLLEETGRDKSAIEAEAYTLVAADLGNVKRMLEFERQGRDKTLRSIAKYRKSFAAQLRQYSDRVLAADKAPRITDGEEN